jgi:hypothetical protein
LFAGPADLFTDVRTGLAGNAGEDTRGMLTETENPAELAHAACRLAASLSQTLVPGKGRVILDRLTQAAVAEG